MIKILFTHVIIEQALNVLFDNLTNNLQTAAGKYKVGNEYEYLSRYYTNQEYGEETGIYYHEDVAHVHVIYTYPKIIERIGDFIKFTCESIDSLTYSKEWIVIDGNSTLPTGSIMFQISLLEKDWSMR